MKQVNSLLVEEIFHSIDLRELLVFCGAGISLSPPASLPAAWPMMEYVRKHYTGIFDCYIKKFELRPEVLFQIIVRHDPDGLIPLLEKLLERGEPNANHQFCAYCLKSGCNVITTNFDTLIEKAAASQGVKFLRSLYGEKFDLTDIAQLLKIHGSIDVTDSMMLTINHINKGLSDKRLTALKKLTERKKILVIGYSGYDQLDIMPALQCCNYEDIIWVDHTEFNSNPIASVPTNSWIDKLPCLRYFQWNTEILTKQFLVRISCSPPPLQTSSQQVSFAIQARICSDILMQHNHYQQVVDLVHENELGSDLDLRIKEFKARYMLGSQIKDYEKEYETILQKIFLLPQKVQRPYLPTVVQYTHDAEKLGELMAIIDNNLQHSDFDEFLAEAAIELAYKMGMHGEIDIAEHYLNAVINFAHNEGDPLLEARALINLCGTGYYRYEKNQKQSILNSGIKLADRAIFLLEHEIFHDEFFLNQARANKAIMLRKKGKFFQALNLYKQVLPYFETHDVNHTIHTLYNMSVTEIELQDYKTALMHLDRALLLNKEHGRNYLLDHIIYLRKNTEKLI